MGFWSCLRCHPNQEKIAIRNLENQDFEYYQPKILERKIIRGRPAYKEQPLFPCYLFVYIESRYACLNSTHGASALLSFNGIPAKIEDKIIDGLRQREQNGYIQLDRLRAFKVGDTVTIKSGPFVGQQALVERMSNKERQKLLLALLNGTKVLIDELELEAA